MEGCANKKCGSRQQFELSSTGKSFKQRFRDWLFNVNILLKISTVAWKTKLKISSLFLGLYCFFHHCTNSSFNKTRILAKSSACDVNYLELQSCSNLNLAILFFKMMRKRINPWSLWKHNAVLLTISARFQSDLERERKKSQIKCLLFAVDDKLE